jgi:hypothetical protein
MIVARLALAALALSACDDSAPRTLLDGPRVVAVIAEPPTVSATGTSTLTLVTALDGLPTAPDSVSWRACSPGRLVVDPVRDCAGDTAEPLPVDDQGRAIVDVAALAARFGVPLPPAMGDDPCGRAVIPLTIVVEAELAGARLIARKQLAVGAAPPPRVNPVIVHAVADGAPLSSGASYPVGTTLELSADIGLDSLDLVCEPDGTTPARHEDVRIAVYAGGGATASDRAFDIAEVEGATIAGSIELTMPDAPSSVPLWLVATDDGGGVAVSHLVLDAR